MNRQKSFENLVTLLLGIFALVTMPVPTAQAGGTSENLVLVVNADAADSKLIANHYIRWRDIPASNVIYLSDIPTGQQITVDQFRDLILKPILTTIEERKLVGQIDYVVYSSNFPTKVNCGSDRKKKFPDQEKFSKIEVPVLSLNSATYYFQSIMAGEVDYLRLNSNFYYRAPASNILANSFVDDDRVIYQRGLEALNADNADLALKELEPLAARHPRHFGLQYQIARCHGKLDQPAQAAEALIRATKNGWQFRQHALDDSLFEQVLSDRNFKKAVNAIPDKPFDFLPTTGFRYRYGWMPNGISTHSPKAGRRYLISTLLAVTTGRGNPAPDALERIRYNIQGDHTYPKGAFVFTKSDDVRSKTRARGIAPAVAHLKKLGIRGEVIPGHIPQNRPNVLGATLGRAGINWGNSKSHFAPGAICDNLTSHGGNMAQDKQTPCTHFLKYGAAGSSGTVVEPFAIQAKFPHPMIHVHYARGATLGETFYQSVHGPFQLLIVGDPLCQPFSKPPRFSADGLKENARKIEGKIRIDLRPSRKNSISHFEVFANGKFRAAIPIDTAVKFDTATLPPGYHEFRIVGVSNDLLETRFRKIFRFTVGDDDEQVELTLNQNRFKLEDEITLTTSCTGAEKIDVFHNGRVVTTIDKASGSGTISCATFGGGPVTLFAVAKVGDKTISSQPVTLEIR